MLPFRRLHCRETDHCPRTQRAGSRSGKKVFEASYGQVWEAIRVLVKRAIKSGDIRKDLDPVDLASEP